MSEIIDSKIFYPKDFLYYYKSSESIGPKEKLGRKNTRESVHTIQLIELNSSGSNLKNELENGLALKSGFWNKLKNKIKSKIFSKKQQKQSRICLLWMDYCRNTSFHGVQYIVDNKLNYLERFFWLLLTVVAAIGVIHLSYLVESRFQRARLATVVESTMYPIYEIPYPAVTILNTNRFDWTRINETLNVFLMSKDIALRQELTDFLVLLDEFEFASFGNFKRHFTKFDHLDVKDMYRKAMHRCENMFPDKCWWRNKYVDCCNLFFLQKSEYGTGYSFNSGTNTVGLNRIKNEKDYPWRTGNSGEWSGLRASVLVQARSENPLDNNLKQYGIYLIIHHPFQWPTTAHFIPSGTMTSIVIKPAYSYATDRVERLPPVERDCVYHKEAAKHRYITLPGLLYLKSNCLSECRKEWLYRLCNCTPDFMYPSGDGKRRCRISDFVCFYKYNSKLNYEKPPEDNQYFPDKEDGLECKCLPECERIDYDVEISPLQTVIADKNRVGLSIHFQQPTMVKYRTDIVFDWIDLIVAFGGIAGLFLGVSVLSIAEIVYYCFMGGIIYYKKIKEHGLIQS